jgi:hypothetical protein
MDQRFQYPFGGLCVLKWIACCAHLDHRLIIGGLLEE